MKQQDQKSETNPLVNMEANQFFNDISLIIKILILFLVIMAGDINKQSTLQGSKQSKVTEEENTCIRGKKAIFYFPGTNLADYTPLVLLVTNSGIKSIKNHKPAKLLHGSYLIYFHLVTGLQSC